MGLRCFFGFHNWSSWCNKGNQNARFAVRECFDCGKTEKVFK